jgi:hypothetical protein
MCPPWDSIEPAFYESAPEWAPACRYFVARISKCHPHVLARNLSMTPAPVPPPQYLLNGKWATDVSTEPNDANNCFASRAL